MKLAVVTVTRNGASLAQRLLEQLPGDLYVKEGRHALSTKFQEYRSLRDLIDTIFFRYDGFIFIMATGIVVRMIAPYIIHKKSDPAVVVLDEKGRHAISLLSGHIGGANTLTLRIANLLKAEAVITTATDVNGKIAPDTIAAELGLLPEPFERLKEINAAIADGETVDFFVDNSLRNSVFYHEELHARGIFPRRLQFSNQTIFHRTSVCVTACDLESEDERVLYLKPRRLSVGIGCRKGASEEEILNALNWACASIGKTTDDIVTLASTVLKSKEAGLLAVANRLNVPIKFFEHELLQTVIEGHRLTISDFVLNKIGVGNICESAALANSQSKKLIVRKIKFPKVTVAIAWEK